MRPLPVVPCEHGARSLTEFSPSFAFGIRGRARTAHDRVYTSYKLAISGFCNTIVAQ